MRITPVFALTLAGFAGACSLKDDAPGDTARAVDTTASPGAAAAVSTATPTDSFPPPPADASGNIIGETRKKSPSRDSIIGRDSAFGPIGTMDSTGRVTPIRR